MAEYSYVAVAQDGKEKKGNIEAENELAVKAQLKSEGLLAIKIAPLGALNKDINISFGSPVKTRELSVFCRQFTSILNAGVTVVQALDMLAGQTENKKFQAAIYEAKSAVEKGETLAESFKLNPKVFPPLLINLVEAGEASGSLDMAFSRMAVQFEKSAKLKALIKKASIYPIMLMIVAFAVLMIMSVLVVPKFAAMFKDLGSELPAVTKLVMKISDFFKYKWYLVLIVLVSIPVIYKFINSSEAGRLKTGKVKIKLPIFGRLNIKTQSANFSRTLSTLISSGLSITMSLDITARSMSNEIYRKAVMDTKGEAERGVPLSSPIKASGVFPDMVPQMIKIGEETGNIEGMLDKVAEYYEDEVEIATQGLSSAIEPLIIIVMAVIVGTIVLAIYMPMIDMYKGLDQL